MKRLVLGLLVALAGCETLDENTSLTVLDKDIAAENGMTMNGAFTNGLRTNGMHLNGLQLNGRYTNGKVYNGRVANGLYTNGQFVNGQFVNGKVINGQFVNGKVLNGMQLNGMNLNGMFTNGRVPNGLYTNGLFPNGQYTNGYYLNGVYTNGINANGYFPNGLSLNGLDAVTSDNHMKYMVGCAWPNGQVLSVTVNDQVYSWTGKMGLAPGFGGEMSDNEKTLLSACLQAETNALGNHVMISLRGEGAALAADQTEINTYKYAEGIFFGDIFDDEASTAYVCEHNGYARYPDNGRLCAYTGPFGGDTVCGFAPVAGVTGGNALCMMDAKNGLGPCAGMKTCTLNGKTYQATQTFQTLEPRWDGFCSGATWVCDMSGCSNRNYTQDLSCRFY